MSFNAQDQIIAWGRPPAGGVNTSTEDLLKLDAVDLLSWFHDARIRQWQQPSNRNNELVDAMCLDTTRGKTIMDYGCGVGFDSLRYLSHRNKVISGDINPNNLNVAKRVAHLNGRFLNTITLTVDLPFFTWEEPIDVFHANGVLHHTPYFEGIMRRVYNILKPDGEARLMLYTDHAWRWATGTEPPSNHVDAHPLFQKFVRTMDAVGSYADWYDVNKINSLIGDLYTVHKITPLNDALYMAVILRPNK